MTINLGNEAKTTFYLNPLQTFVKRIQFGKFISDSNLFKITLNTLLYFYFYFNNLNTW